MTRQRVDICTAWQKVSGVFKAPAVLAVAILLSLSGCGKEKYAVPAGTWHGGPANVMLVLGSPSVKSGEDYNSIHSIRIYAFRNGSDNTAPVGYFYNEDISGEGPFYCPIDLKESGSLDFLVLLNDNRIETGDFNVRDENTTRSQLEDITFTGIDRGEDDGIGPIVPMCNERITGAGIDANNFTFTVEENSDWQIIPVDVKRSVGKAILKLAKSGEIDVNVTNVSLSKGPMTAPLVLQDDVINATGYYYGTNNNSETLIDLNTAVELADGEPANIAETLLLPNPYGSSHADRFEAEDNNYDSVDRTYRLDITYTVRPHDTSQTTTTTKTVFLPQVRANENLIIEGTISSRADVTMNVIVNSWTEHNIDVPPFE